MIFYNWKLEVSQKYDFEFHEVVYRNYSGEVENI